MSKNFKMEAKVCRSLLEALLPFKSEKNAVRIEVGKTGKADGDNLGSVATLVNGGTMVTKGFYVKKPADYTEGSIYAAINLKAKDFLAYMQAMAAYEQDITITVEDVAVMISVGKMAGVSLGVIPDEEMSPMLPQDSKSVIASITLDACKFQRVARQGCSAGDADVAPKLSDRVVFRVSEDMLEAYSTDAHVIEKAWMEAAVSFNTENFLKAGIAAKAASLDDVEKTELASQVDKAIADGRLEAFAKEKGADMDRHVFALSLQNFNIFCQAVKGGDTVTVIVTPAYIYAKNGSTLSAYALAGEASAALFHVADNFDGAKYPVKVAVDIKDLLKGISLLDISGETKHTGIVFKGASDMLGICCGNTIASTALIEKDGDESMINARLSSRYVRSILSGLEGGNAVFWFPTDRKTPVLISKGDLSLKEAESRAFILQVYGKDEDKTGE